MEYAISISILVCLLIYAALALVLLRGLERSSWSEESSGAADFPAVSVVIAVRNEEANILELLKSLQAQDYSNFDVVIVDDASSDNTRGIAEDFCRNKTNFRVIPAAENTFGWGPKKNAIHTSILQSRGEIILTTDADCRPQSGWIRSITAKFTGEIGAVVGYSPLIFDNTIAGRLKSLEALAAAIIAAAFIGEGKPFLAAGRSFAYRRSLYLEIGGFGESGRAPAGDDDLLLQRIGKYTKTAFSFNPNTIVPSYPEAGDYIARKRRHFTVAKRYPLQFILTGAVVFLLIAGITALIIWGLITFAFGLLTAGVCAFILKVICDYILLSRGAKKLGDDFRLSDMFLAELIQIPYTLILQPLSFIGKIKWRGRKL